MFTPHRGPHPPGACRCSRIGGFALATLLVSLIGCSTAVRTVRLDTGQGKPIVFTPRSGVQPVELDGGEFEDVVQKLGSNVPVTASPRDAALRLFAESQRPRDYSHVRAQLGVISVEEPQRDRLLVPGHLDADTELASAYMRWCKRRSASGDCLRLFETSPTFDEDARRTLAFHIALDSVWDETAKALEDVTDRDAVIAMLATTGAVYLGLWLLPEPVSKGVAAVLTVALISWLGWDTVWSLVQGFRVLAAQVKVATTFEEVRAAGERYGGVMGRNAARVFVMLATAALGSTAQTLAARLPTLPGSAQAALAGAGQGGFRLVAAEGVQAVAVSSGGTISITLAPGAVAMTARGPNAAASTPVEAEGHEHHIATNKWWDSNSHGGPWSPRFQEVFDRAGMSLDDPANKIRVNAHKGPHPREYHQEIYARLRDATSTCRSIHRCREALTSELQRLARVIATPGTRLNRLVTGKQ